MLSHNPNLAAALLRITSGVYFLIHGLVKIAVFTPAGTAGYFQSIGLPAFLAYFTIAIEVLGGIALILGWRVREISLAFVPVLLGAAYFGHGSNGFLFSAEGGGWEYPVYWAIVMVAQIMLGAGAYAIGKQTS